MTAPWLWLAVGLGLAILEVLVPTWIFLGFALGAFALGTVLAFGGPAASLAASSPAALLLLYAVLSLIAWGGLRAALGTRKGQVRIWTRDINDDGPPTSR